MITHLVHNKDQMAAFLKKSLIVKQILEDAAKEVEAVMPEAIQDNIDWLEANSDAARMGELPPYEQKVYREEGAVTDRQRQIVGIENAHYSDFIFNTPATAVREAGGVFKRKRKRKRRKENKEL